MNSKLIALIDLMEVTSPDAVFNCELFESLTCDEQMVVMQHITS